MLLLGPCLVRNVLLTLVTTPDAYVPKNYPTRTRLCLATVLNAWLSHTIRVQGIQSKELREPSSSAAHADQLRTPIKPQSKPHPALTFEVPTDSGVGTACAGAPQGSLVISVPLAAANANKAAGTRAKFLCAKNSFCKNCVTLHSLANYLTVALADAKKENKALHLHILQLEERVAALESTAQSALLTPQLQPTTSEEVMPSLRGSGYDNNFKQQVLDVYTRLLINQRTILKYSRRLKWPRLSKR